MSPPSQKLPQLIGARRGPRSVLNTLFTSLSGLSVVLMAAALVIILVPILWRGSSAVIFRGTVEWRVLQFQEPLFNRGDTQEIKAEMEEVAEARAPVYALLDEFSRGIDVESLADQAKQLYRRYKDQLRHREAAGRITHEQYLELRRAAKKIRDTFEDALYATERSAALDLLQAIQDTPEKQRFEGTVAEAYFELARRYRRTVETVDLTRRDQYLAELEEVKEILYDLFGPRPGRQVADLVQEKYGATRWDRAQELLHKLKWDERWVEVTEGELREKKLVRRAETFEGTILETLFPMVEQNAEAMLHPRPTFYWQYFLDDSLPGHFVGGIGKEIVGTLILTGLCMAFAVPVSIIAAAYLVECAKDTLFVRVIRTCINTLAGVPSIVFGLFGLALFLDFLPGIKTKYPGWFGWVPFSDEKNFMAGAMTMAILVLPIMIRASEEAIRSVPQTYKEASLSLGAGGFRTFMTVTLPAALPGVLTGIILSMSRAAGETAPILFILAVSYRPGLPNSLWEGGAQMLSYSSYDVAVSDRVAMDLPHQQYGITMTLILLVLGMNVAAILIRSRVAKRLRGQ